MDDRPLKKVMETTMWILQLEERKQIIRMIPLL